MDFLIFKICFLLASSLDLSASLATPYNTSVYFETPRFNPTDELAMRITSWNQVDCFYNYMTCLNHFHQTDRCLLSLQACSRSKEIATATTSTTLPPPPPPATPRGFNHSSTKYIKTCEEIQSNQSGVYQVDFQGSPKLVYCFWRGNRSFTIVQRRGQFSSGEDYFNKGWKEYEKGFGEPDKEHWIGLSHLHELTKAHKDLTFLLLNQKKRKAAIIFLNAYLRKESGDGYSLHYDAIAAYDESRQSSSDLGKSAPRSGLRFSTFDRNPYPRQPNCAKILSGGWWYDPYADNCGHSNLNGLNYNGPYINDSDNGIIWRTFTGSRNSLLSTKMFIGKPRRRAAFKITLYSAKDMNMPMGEVSFEEGYGVLIIKGAILGIKKGKHGVSINENGVLKKGCQGTGHHFNPFKQNHGPPTSEDKHEGDLGNLHVFEDGAITQFTFLSRRLQIADPSPESYHIKERSFVIYENEDDLGFGSSPESKSNGNVGQPLACGLING